MQNSLKNKLNNLSPEQIRKLLASRKKLLKNNTSKTFEKMPRNSEDQYPLSKAQERMWFLSYLFKNTSLYNIPVAIKIHKAICLENLELAIEQIVINNAILRTTFHEKNGEIYQQIHSKYKPSIDFQDISNIESKKKLIEEILLGHSSKIFNLTQLPLFAIKLIKITEKEFILLLNLHHIITDGWTNALLSNDLHLDYKKLNYDSDKPYS